MREIQASQAAFAAILEDGSVVTWGPSHRGGDSRSVQGQLRNLGCWSAFFILYNFVPKCKYTHALFHPQTRKWGEGEGRH